MNEELKPKRVYSEETKRRMAEARRGKKWDDATKAKMRAAKLGKKQSEEHRRKAAEAKIGLKRTPEQRAKMSEIHKGKHPEFLDPEVRARGQATRVAKYKGVPRSEEVKAKIRAAKQAKPFVYTDEIKAKMSEAQKRNNALRSDDERAVRFATFTKAGKEAAGNIVNDTTIELYIAEFLREVGIEFEHPFQAGRFQADFYIPAINTIVEAQGCYWHGCEQCGFEGEHAEMQRAKDRRRFGYFKEQGYKIKTIWEHEIKQNIMDNLLRIVEKVNESKKT